MKLFADLGDLSDTWQYSRRAQKFIFTALFLCYNYQK
jgi:hypothetical protein